MSSAHIIYAALFRLAIIAAGFGCVMMGYRLFVLGVMPQEGSDLDTELGQVRLSVKNAAPGTCFAAMGIFSIVVMVIQGNPEVKIVEVPTQEGLRVESTFRSDDEDTTNTTPAGKEDYHQEATWPAHSDVILPAMARGRELEVAGQLNKALRAYVEPLKNGALPLRVAIEPLRAIAAVYRKQDRLDEGLAYARLAYLVEPGNAEGLALIARIQLGRGNYAEAISYMSRAASIDASYIPERERLKEQAP